MLHIININFLQTVENNNKNKNENMLPAKGYSETGTHIPDSKFCLYFIFQSATKVVMEREWKVGWIQKNKVIKGENFYSRNRSKIHSSTLKYYSHFFKCTVSKECVCVCV